MKCEEIWYLFTFTKRTFDTNFPPRKDKETWYV